MTQEIIDGVMTLADGTKILLTAGDFTAESLQEDFGVTNFASVDDNVFRVQVFSENFDLVDAVLDLNLKSGLEEYPDWYDIVQLRISFFSFSCRLLKSEIDSIAGEQILELTAKQFQSTDEADLADVLGIAYQAL